jgi:phage FluMu protein Com
MELEEQGGVEQLKERCESCGALLTQAEMEAALEGTGGSFLCARCAAEQIEVTEDLEQS